MGRLDARTSSPRVVLQAPSEGRIVWLEFDSPRELLVARSLEEVRPVLRRAALAAERGEIAAGFVAYEAAPAFDPAMRVRAADGEPLAWFAVFSQPRLLAELPATPPPSPEVWTPSLSKAQYREAIATIHRHIGHGDTYQVNFTLRLAAAFRDDPWNWFLALCGGQRSECCAYVDTGEIVLCSVSPELFFELELDRIRCKPMKGTAARGRTLEEDRRQGAWLQDSSKNRAENVMIVDMVRNDLGRIAVPGTVRVLRLWELEKYPSLFQLTSTVEARTEANLDDVFAALFPCASITGAPKIRAMEIISRLETSPRGAYTGAIGIFGPGRRARFNVAIRTVQVDRQHSRAVYGTGGGIVWDSAAEGEWQECRTKALVLAPQPPPFELLETLLWEPERGYFLLSRHLTRLGSSAMYFDVPLDEQRARDLLLEHAATLPPRSHRVRLLVAGSGEMRIESRVWQTTSERWRIALAKEPIDALDPFLYHKTTHRQVYDRRRQDHPDLDDVLLWNTRGEITETTLANVVIRFGDSMVTPPVESGLLAGTFRAELLDRQEIEAAPIPKETLRSADQIWLINSLRQWIPAGVERPETVSAPETRSVESS